ncbi:Beauvericin cluster-specific repressor BEA4 [Metarhizium anisopliae]|nr:Beauvericin cluster-specific repressor BEA4 [Metarhizium anisopliae]
MFPPTRIRITRSRNGCAVCKCKRLKCDEARPSCSRCQRLGIVCPGYQKPLKWTTSLRTPEETSSSPVASPSRPLPNWAAYSFAQPPAEPPALSTVDVSGSELLDQFTNPLVTGANGITQHDGLASDSPFDHLSGGTTPSFEQTPGPMSGGMYQPFDEDGCWPNSLLSETRSEFDMPTLFESPSQPWGSRCEMPLAQALQDHTSILVEYYFKEVCGMMSCYDSQMNPYRTTISNIWSGSQSLYYVTQSMAAACLSDVMPGLSSLGKQLRDQAALCLSMEARESQMETSSLLALVMLGMSLSWHDPDSVGQLEFEILAKTVSSSGSGQINSTLAHKHKRVFFYNSLVYWQMLLAFVTDRDSNLQGMTQNQPQPAPFEGPETSESHIPHPQTGIGIQVQRLVAKVASLVRKERNRIRNRQFASRNDIDQAKTAILDAERLHSELCAIQLPREDEIIDSGDEMTPADHLVKVAEAYRCTGLLQLYRNFPDLLSAHASLCKQKPRSVSSSSLEDSGPSSDAAFSQDVWLTGLALHILDLIQDIPTSSRSRSIQPLLFVSICSELALGRGSVSLPDVLIPPVASIAASPRFKAPATDLDVLRARKFVIARLSSFENILAAKPIRRMLLLVKETWKCMEEKQQNVYWMDVMMEKGYGTLMG